MKLVVWAPALVGLPIWAIAFSITFYSENPDIPPINESGFDPNDQTCHKIDVQESLRGDEALARGFGLGSIKITTEKDAGRISPQLIPFYIDERLGEPCSDESLASAARLYDLNADTDIAQYREIDQYYEVGNKGKFSEKKKYMGQWGPGNWRYWRVIPDGGDEFLGFRESFKTMKEDGDAVQKVVTPGNLILWLQSQSAVRVEVPPNTKPKKKKSKRKSKKKSKKKPNPDGSKADEIGRNVARQVLSFFSKTKMFKEDPVLQEKLDQAIEEEIGRILKENPKRLFSPDDLEQLVSGKLDGLVHKVFIENPELVGEAEYYSDESGEAEESDFFKANKKSEERNSPTVPSQLAKKTSSYKSWSPEDYQKNIDDAIITEMARLIPLYPKMSPQEVYKLAGTEVVGRFRRKVEADSDSDDDDSAGADVNRAWPSSDFFEANRKPKDL